MLEAAAPEWPPPQFASGCCEVELLRAGRAEEEEEDDEEVDAGIAEATS